MPCSIADGSKGAQGSTDEDAWVRLYTRGLWPV